MNKTANERLEEILAIKEKAYKAYMEFSDFLIKAEMEAREEIANDKAKERFSRSVYRVCGYVKEVNNEQGKTD